MITQQELNELLQPSTTGDKVNASHEIKMRSEPIKTLLWLHVHERAIEKVIVDEFDKLKMYVQETIEFIKQNKLKEWKERI